MSAYIVPLMILAKATKRNTLSFSVMSVGGFSSIIVFAVFFTSFINVDLVERVFFVLYADVL